MDRRDLLTVFLVGFVSLAYELVQVRMLSFFLGNGMDFLAIPVALLGLAVGSMACHFLYRGPHDRLVSRLSSAILPLLLATFFVLFAVANHVFPEVHASHTDPYEYARRIVVYGLVFLPPYVAFGGLLAAAFARAGDRAGRLYFYDLVGAGLGCAFAPLLLAWTDLWPTLVGVLLGALALLSLHRRPAVTAVGALAVLGVGVLASQGLALRERPDVAVLSHWAIRGQPVEQLWVRWNPIARTALVRGKRDGNFAIVQDNGISNVTVASAEPRPRADVLRTARHHAIPWRLGREPRAALVMFAGAGRDLVTLDALARGEAALTGVEINPDVVHAPSMRRLEHLGLAPFLARPGIALVHDEGRHFLDHTEDTYDLVYVANNGAVSANRTGHTRKFLDTCQAMAQYLDHLSPDGTMVFVNQPIEEKIPCFRRLFEERGLGDPARAIFAFGWPDLWMLDSMVVVPQGLSDADLRTLRSLARAWSTEVLYDPDGDGLERTRRLVERPLSELRLVTDDRPFTQPLDLADLDVIPSTERLSDPPYVAAWLKVFTVVLFAAVSAVVAGLARYAGGHAGRVPVPWVAYLLASGVGFMCVEIPLIARTELFVGNPLYAVALNLALFLVASACGAMAQDRWRSRSGPLVLAAAAVVGVAWGLAATEVCNRFLLALPLLGKAVALAVAVFPAGMALGAFYPYAVGRLVQEGRPAAVPMSYGLSTLSSVLGSSFAMTAMIELGFTRMIVVGAALYVLAGAIGYGRR